MGERANGKQDFARNGAMRAFRAHLYRTGLTLKQDSNGKEPLRRMMRFMLR
jgi:hypothetical protein